MAATHFRSFSAPEIVLVFFATRLSGDPNFFLFNDTSPPKIYTLSLHDALPISTAQLIRQLPAIGVTVLGPFGQGFEADRFQVAGYTGVQTARRGRLGVNGIEEDNLGRALKRDRKSTRLNSSHRCISYAVFCLKK